VGKKAVVASAGWLRHRIVYALNQGDRFMTRIATGGKAIQGASVGILMLQARFPRIPGDIGNAGTWPFPVHYRVVSGASPDRVVRQRAVGLQNAFIDAAQELVAMGCDGITTNCGFLSLIQNDLATAVGVPVATSSLMQYQMIQSLLPPVKRVGVLTISSANLTADHLAAANVPLDAPVVGTDELGGEFTRVIVGNEERLDVEAAERDLLQAADALVERHPDVGAVLLECTNMTPYSDAIAAHTGLPVFDMYGFISWFQTGLRPRRFS
jgi:Asp/Glu/hydantoin racemase